MSDSGLPSLGPKSPQPLFTVLVGYETFGGRICELASGTVDHVRPWAEGGPTAEHNGRAACGYHNRLRRRPP